MYDKPSPVATEQSNVTQQGFTQESLFNGHTNISPEPLYQCPDESPQSKYCVSLLETLQEKSQLCDTAELKDNIQSQLSVLSGQLHFVEDKDTLKNVGHFITSAINIIKVNKSYVYQNITKNHLTKKLNNRGPFSRKRKTTNVRIKKPTVQEKNDILCSR